MSEDSDYADTIIRQWKKVNTELDRSRVQRYDLNVKIKALVKEKDRLRKLVRIVQPEEVSSNGEQPGE